MQKDQLANFLAVSAASLFISACGKDTASTANPDEAAAAPDSAAAGDATVHCFGINECSGQSACDVKDSHVCAGQNECAGKGWIEVKRSVCDEKGGEVV
jgi:hypothetical protein